MIYEHDPSPSHMLFRAQPWTFRLVRADNGFIFEEYDISTDETVRKVATSAEELRSLFDAWFCARSSKLVAWADEYLTAQAEEPRPRLYETRQACDRIVRDGRNAV